MSISSAKGLVATFAPGYLALVGLLLCLASCRTFDPKHPMIGKPEIDAHQPAFWIWTSDGVWHVRASTGGRAHRFQGSVAGVAGGVAELTPTRPELKDRIAMVGDSVQFDVESSSDETLDGFDVRLVGGCARFDLYLDGHHRAERVRMGPRSLQPKRVPFERCP